MVLLFECPVFGSPLYSTGPFEQFLLFHFQASCSCPTWYGDQRIVKQARHDRSRTQRHTRAWATNRSGRMYLLILFKPDNPFFVFVLSQQLFVQQFDFENEKENCNDDLMKKKLLQQRMEWKRNSRCLIVELQQEVFSVCALICLNKIVLNNQLTSEKRNLCAEP